MYSALYSSHPLDLLSYPLTYTYFSVIDHYIRFIKEPTSVPHKSFVRTLQSFLFLYEDNPKNIQKLNNFAFAEQVPYECIAPSQLYRLETSLYPEGAQYYSTCKYKLTFPMLYTTYSKQFIKLKKAHATQEVFHLNRSFLHLQKRLVYSNFHDETLLPTLFKVTDAESFIKEISQLVEYLTGKSQIN